MFPKADREIPITFTTLLKRGMWENGQVTQWLLGSVLCLMKFSFYSWEKDRKISNTWEKWSQPWNNSIGMTLNTTEEVTEILSKDANYSIFNLLFSKKRLSPALKSSSWIPGAFVPAQEFSANLTSFHSHTKIPIHLKRIKTGILTPPDKIDLKWI